MYEISVKQICEKIWELEDKYNLLYKEINGVKVWQYLRMKIYYQIAQQTGVFTKPHTTKNSLWDKIKAFPCYLYNAILKNPLKGNYQKDILIFDHSRKIYVDGEYIDIYTKYLLDNLDVNDYNYDVIERPYLRKHWTKKEPNRKYLDYLSISSFIPKKLYRVKFSEYQLKYIKTVEKEINGYFNISINLKRLFIKGIKNFKYNYKFYNKLFKKRKPSKVYVVVSYGKAALISAAKDNDIQVIEIQHGTFSPYHLGYNFPECNKELEYFPDVFYIFGEYWSESVKLPVKEENIISYGFPYMNKRIKKYSDIEKKEKQILFISQGVIGQEMSKIAYKVAQRLKDYNIIYKLHPGEYDRWKSEYEELVLANKLKNFEVIDHNNKDLYDYFASSNYLVGVFSTAIYEGLVFGCKTVLVNLPGIEYMQFLIEQDIVKVSDNADEVCEKINEFGQISYEKEYFFK